MARLPRVTGREVARALKRHGFLLSRVQGSHHIYRHEETGLRAVVPIHANRVIPPGTLVNIIKHIGVDVDLFVSWLHE